MWSQSTGYPCAGGWAVETADRLVIGGPVFFLYAKLTASSAGAATAVLYEGSTTEGRLLNTLSAPASETDELRPGVALLCERGIYLDIGLNVTGVLVVWDAVRFV